MASKRSPSDQLSTFISQLNRAQRQIQYSSAVEPPPTDDTLPLGRRQPSMAPRNSWEEKIIQEMPFVIRQAKKWEPGGTRAGLTVMDLTMEGFAGLLKAIKKFDPSRGITFHTMARWWIVASITRAIDQSVSENGYRVSGPASNQLRNVRKMIRDYNIIFNADPSTSEIAETLSLSEKRVRSLLSTAQYRAASLEQPATNDEKRTVGEMLRSTNAQPDSQLAKKEAYTELQRAMTFLTDRERLILAKRYGLNGEASTLNEIAAELNLSRERVRQIEREAQAILRERLEELRACLTDIE